MFMNLIPVMQMQLIEYFKIPYKILIKYLNFYIMQIKGMLLQGFVYNKRLFK